MDLISIVITTYNRPQWLDQAISSAVGQTYQPVEVIVVDDGSEKDDARIIAKKYTGVKYLYQRNQGPGAARNHGISSSKGKWVQFLDDDDWLAPDCIQKKHNLFIEQPEIDAVYSDIYLCDKNGKNLKRYYQNFSRPLPTGDIFIRLLNHNFITLHALLWRRTTLDVIGGFPERWGHEDWEFLIKASMSAKFGYIDQPLGFYRQHRKSISRDFEIMYSGKLEFQKDIVGSERFRSLADRDRINLLCKYSIQQWGFGQTDLTNEFLVEAQRIDEKSQLPRIIKIWMKTGRPATRAAIRIFGNMNHIKDKF